MKVIAVDVGNTRTRLTMSSRVTDLAKDPLPNTPPRVVDLAKDPLPKAGIADSLLPDPKSKNPAKLSFENASPAATRSQVLSQWITSQAVAENDSGATPVFWSVCSVNKPAATWLEQWVATVRGSSDRFHLIAADDVPLESAVIERDRVGRDRLVAAFAAWSYFQTTSKPGNAQIVIDVGTAVTIDVVDNGVFLGGLIYPGAGLNFRSLNDFTSQLPDRSSTLSATDDSSGEKATQSSQLFGNDTNSAIDCGVNLSQASALSGIVNRLQNRYPTATVFLTGGGASSQAEWLDGGLPDAWIHWPDMVLVGCGLVGQALESAS